jgi:GNAT superfamily N-acetyltransferase
MGVDHRVISVADSIFKIFGVIDLCVLPEYQRQGIATQLLTSLTKLAEEKSIDFLFLVANDFMVKQIGEKSWRQDGLMDLLGYRF